MELTGDSWHREQRRKSQDLIRVLNPTQQDYILLWDQEKFIVPSQEKDMGWGKGMRVMQRYLAEKYVREMKDKLILQKQDAKLAEIKEKLEKSGAADVSFNANMQLSTVQGVRSDVPEIIEKYYEMLWLGVEEEFGMDDMSQIQSDGQVPTTSERDVMDKFANKKYQKPEEVQVSAPITEEVPRLEPLPLAVRRSGRPRKV